MSIGQEIEIEVCWVSSVAGATLEYVSLEVGTLESKLHARQVDPSCH